MATLAPLRLGFLMFPGFPMACLTSAIEPLRAANEISGRRQFEWRLVAESHAPVRSSAEVRFEPDVTLAECEGLDHLYILSPPTGAFADPRHGQARLRWLERTGVVLGAFSGGIFPLARAGLMEGKGCSVHWCYEAAFKAEFPKVEASEAVILRDGRRITASGAGAVFDLMLRLIEERLGRQCMTEVACWFQHPFVRDEDASQKVPVARTASTADRLPPAIREAIRLFETHVEDPLRIPDVAAAVDVPVYLYDNPVLTKNVIQPATVVKLRERIPHLRGIKVSNADYANLQTLIELFRKDDNFAVLTGHEFLILVGLQMGCEGFIGGIHNICPHIAVGLYEAFRRGDIERARQLQQDLIATWQVFRHGAIWGAFDEALRYLEICERATGEPYVTALQDEERTAVRGILDQYVRPYLTVAAGG